MKNIYYLIIIVVIFVGCNDKTFNYSIISFQNDKFKIHNDIIFPNDLIDKIENGEWRINDQNHDLISAGLFSKGFKTGEWKYNSGNNKIINIYWERDGIGIYNFNFIKGWQLINRDDMMLMSINTESKFYDDKIFGIKEYSNDTFKNLNHFVNVYMDEMDKENVLGYSLISIKKSSNNYYLLRYKYSRRENEVLMSIVTLFEYKTKFYEVFLNFDFTKSKSKRYIAYLDILGSLKINDERVFSPFDSLHSITKLQIQSE